MFSGTQYLFGSAGKPIPTGVNQNQLGDCWFLASAAAVAEKPERILRIMWNRKMNANGAYRFYFWVKNKWVGINVDDRLPCGKKSWHKENGKWIKAVRPMSNQRSTKGSWWMALLEKSFAKLNQNYERIVSGNPAEALRHLTGMPVVSYTPSKAGYWTEKRLADANYPMSTLCCNYGSHGLTSGHAYTLLNVVTLSDGTRLA